jgi:hypothetical protein
VTESSINEPHFQSTPTGALFFNSAFAHGHRHGYEEGFHMGDLDIQMGREPRQVEKTSEFRHDREGFKAEFGDKNSFRNGYQRGFRIGYMEAFAGLPFRGTQRAANAASGLKEFLPTSQRSSFDQGFQGGYLSASSLAKPHDVTLQYAEHYCQSAAAGQQQRTGEYCAGYSRGYIFGVSDSTIANKSLGSLRPHSK